jgi:SSS family solute:Na+ symporter
MAFMGVGLGLISRVAYQNGMFEALGFAAGTGMDAEMGLPLLLRTIMPVGLMGLILSAYFSAILSTADSCLMASSSNIMHDLLQRLFPNAITEEIAMKASKIMTLLLGFFAVFIAMQLTEVLSLMLYSYAFMVSGLLIPLLAAVFLNQRNELAALGAMIAGGGTTISLLLFEVDLPFGLDANVFGITASFLIYLIIYNTQKIFKHGNSNL